MSIGAVVLARTFDMVEAVAWISKEPLKIRAKPGSGSLVAEERHKNIEKSPLERRKAVFHPADVHMKILDIDELDRRGARGRGGGSKSVALAGAAHACDSARRSRQLSSLHEGWRIQGERERERVSFQYCVYMRCHRNVTHRLPFAKMTWGTS
ncbi:uncharacterized protein PSFLO_05457 [Pseudozyma flocculosa]|uniref:Uncharacterized protein n=1 Tax=Pseudozyma flocculosa TaxID=84751 RepID=A0A5C3F8J3_9BASI|nr:uncharacterized protein PSFLO_05457 [Pseudozyma flocculosa]